MTATAAARARAHACSGEKVRSLAAVAGDAHPRASALEPVPGGRPTAGQRSSGAAPLEAEPCGRRATLPPLPPLPASKHAHTITTAPHTEAAAARQRPLLTTDASAPAPRPASVARLSSEGLPTGRRAQPERGHAMAHNGVSNLTACESQRRGQQEQQVVSTITEPPPYLRPPRAQSRTAHAQQLASHQFAYALHLFPPGLRPRLTVTTGAPRSSATRGIDGLHATRNRCSDVAHDPLALAMESSVCLVVVCATTA